MAKLEGRVIDTQDLEKVVALTLASAYIKGERPLSLMIVSDRPESGKTDTVNRFDVNKRVAYLNDVTAYALWRDFGKDLANGNIKHFFIPEFLAPISRQSQTVASFIATLQMLIEEGLKEIHTGFLEPIKLKNPVTVGAVVCLPRNAFGENKLSWEISGFLSRFLVITYRYNDNTIEKVFDSIENREYLTETKTDLYLPDQEIAVRIPKDIANKCRVLAQELTAQSRKDGKVYGYRELKNIFKLIGAMIVLGNCNGSDRTVVNEDDLSEVMRLSYLFTENFNALKGEDNDKSTEVSS